jgi:TPP-dependent 2-oxoacid decarboxylase
MLEKIKTNLNNLIDAHLHQKDIDMNEIGNIIGLSIADYITNNDGFTVEDFISGLNHGIYLINYGEYKTQINAL